MLHGTLVSFWGHASLGDKVFIRSWYMGQIQATYFCPADRWVLAGVVRVRKDFSCFWGKTAGHCFIGLCICGGKGCQSLCLFPPLELLLPWCSACKCTWHPHETCMVLRVAWILPFPPPFSSFLFLLFFPFCCYCVCCLNQREALNGGCFYLFMHISGGLLGGEGCISVVVTLCHAHSRNRCRGCLQLIWERWWA